MPKQTQGMEDIARRVRTALDTSDLTAFRELLDPDVKWGAPHDRKPACKNREQVIAWYERGKLSGVEGRVSEIEILGECLLVCLTVRGTQTAEERGGSELRWQVQTVRNGLVIDIVGFDDRNDAIAYAETPLQSR